MQELTGDGEVQRFTRQRSSSCRTCSRLGWKGKHTLVALLDLVVGHDPVRRRRMRKRWDWAQMLCIAVEWRRGELSGMNVVAKGWCRWWSWEKGKVGRMGR